MSDLKEKFEVAELQANAHTNFVEYIGGKTVEDALGFIKIGKIDNTKHVFVVSVQCPVFFRKIGFIC